MQSNSDVIKIFSYTKEEQTVFPYLQKYMDKIKPHIPQIAENTELLEKFMLAGLFLTYRASNHSNVSMSTIDIKFFDPIDIKRLETYKQITGKDIKNQDEYLKLIRFNILKLLILGAANFLYRFVLFG